MVRWSFGIVVGLLTCALAAPAHGQSLGSPILSQDAVQRYGLRRAWFAHVQLDPARDRLVRVLYYQPSPTSAEAPAANAADGEVAQDQDDGGQDDQAAAPAGDWSPSWKPGFVLAQSQQNVLHAFDAETGRTLWVTQIGDRLKASEPPAISDRFVAVINGLRVYLLNRANGEVVWEKQMQRVSMAGPALSDEWIYVAGVTGTIQGMRIPDEIAHPRGRYETVETDSGEKETRVAAARSLYDVGATWSYTAFGAIDQAPIVTRRSLIWGTSRGQVSIANPESGGVPLRFDTNSPVTAAIAYWPPYIYVPTEAGQLYAVRDGFGLTPWRFAIREPIRRKPAAFEESVFITPVSNVLHAVNRHDGSLRWTIPSIEEFLAASPSRIYLINEQRQLQIHDRKSGVRLGTIPLRRTDVYLQNERSDRIILGSERGVLQCLHEIGLPRPALHEPPTNKEIEQQEATRRSPAAEEEGF